MSSPNSDDLRIETSKMRAQRIDPTYYRTPDPLHRKKRVFVVVAAVLSLGWVGAGYFCCPQQHSPGDLAAVHSAWETKCEACHTPGEPLTATSVALWGADHEPFGSHKCQACHKMAHHHDRLSDHDELACAACHHDHRGAAASLLDVADRACVHCHADPAARSALATAAEENLKKNGSRAQFPPASPFIAASIRSFEKGHPEFKSLAQADPGKLKFSHARHLAPGQKLKSDGLERPKRLDELPLRYQDEFRKFARGPDQVLTLDCSACHTTDSRSPSGGSFVHRDDGAYMQPINFERHCAACHQIAFAPVAEAGAKLEELAHGMSPDAMKRSVRASIVEHLRNTGSEPAALSGPILPGIPGKPEVPAADEASNRRLLESLDKNFPNAAYMVHKACVHCHEFASEDAESPLDSKIEATNIREVWLRGARFNHQSHRTMDCAACHKQAYEPWDKKWPPDNHSEVMIPNYQNCVTCHSSRASAAGLIGVRSDCTTCHRYHGIGFADSLRGPPATPRLSIEQAAAGDTPNVLQLMGSKK